MVLTRKMLKKMGACEEHLLIFAKEWPDGADITAANLARAWELNLSVGWLADLATGCTPHLVDLAWEHYYRATSATRRAYLQGPSSATVDAHNAAVDAQEAILHSTISAGILEAMAEREKPGIITEPDTPESKGKTVAELVRIDVETTIANEGLRGTMDVNRFHSLSWRAMCRAAGTGTLECYEAGRRGDIILAKARQEAAKTGRAFADCAREQLAAWESRQVTAEEAAAFHEQEDRKARDVDGLYQPDA